MQPPAREPPSLRPCRSLRCSASGRVSLGPALQTPGASGEPARRALTSHAWTRCSSPGSTPHPGQRGGGETAIRPRPPVPPPRPPAPHRPGSPPGMSDKVKDKFSITFSIVGMFASHAVGSLSVFFCAEITPTVIRCVWAAHGAGRGVFQGHWGCGGRCLAQLVNDPPALARVSGQGAACTGRPLGMDCCSTLTPRDPRIRRTEAWVPSRWLEGRGAGLWGYKPHKRTW